MAGEERAEGCALPILPFHFFVGSPGPLDATCLYLIRPTKVGKNVLRYYEALCDALVLYVGMTPKENTTAVCLPHVRLTLLSRSAVLPPPPPPKTTQQ